MLEGSKTLHVTGCLERRFVFSRVHKAAARVRAPTGSGRGAAQQNGPVPEVQPAIATGIVKRKVRTADFAPENCGTASPLTLDRGTFTCRAVPPSDPAPARPTIVSPRSTGARKLICELSLRVSRITSGSFPRMYSAGVRSTICQLVHATSVTRPRQAAHNRIAWLNVASPFLPATLASEVPIVYVGSFIRLAVQAARGRTIRRRLRTSAMGPSSAHRRAVMTRRPSQRTSQP